MIRIISLASLSFASCTVHEFALWPEIDGSYSIDAHASMCWNSSSRQFPMTVGIYDTSIVKDTFRTCDISITTLPGLSFRVRDESTHFSSVADRSFLGLGPGSRIASTYGVDIIDSILKIGTSVSQFANSCYPGTLFSVPTQSFFTVNVVTARFDLVDPSTDSSSMITEPELVELRFIPGQSSLATIPRILARRLNENLTAHHAVRSESEDPDVWAYTNCTLATIPNLSIAFYTQSGEVAGTIQLTADEFMPTCEFRVHSDVAAASLDIFKLPNINKRIGHNEITFCDSPIDT